MSAVQTATCPHVVRNAAFPYRCAVCSQPPAPWPLQPQPEHRTAIFAEIEEDLQKAHADDHVPDAQEDGMGDADYLAMLTDFIGEARGALQDNDPEFREHLIGLATSVVMAIEHHDGFTRTVLAESHSCEGLGEHCCAKCSGCVICGDAAENEGMVCS